MYKRQGLSWSDLTQKPKEEPAVENANADDPSARSTSQSDAEEEPGAKFGVGKLMFSIMTFSFLCRLFDAIPAYDDPFSFVGGSAIFALILVGAVFLVIVAKLRERFNAALTYRLSLPIMVAGFVAIALFFDCLLYTSRCLRDGAVRPAAPASDRPTAADRGATAPPARHRRPTGSARP